jgi:hypothetical protein
MGYPNKPATAAIGKNLINAAIRSWGIANEISIDSWPENLNEIAYEVKIMVGNNPPKALTFVLRQSLDLLPSTV